MPASAVDIEKSVLGYLLTHSYKVDDVATMLPTSDYFYKDEHQQVYDAILSLHYADKGVDMMMVVEELLRMGKLESIGGPAYVAGLTQYETLNSKIESHCLVLKEKYIKRKLAVLAYELMDSAYGGSDVFEDLDRISLSLIQLTATTSSADPVSFNEVLPEAISDIMRIRDLNEDFVGIRTGAEELDEITGGWQPGNLIVLAARPGCGKTTMAVNMMGLAAAKSDKPTLVFSLEMSRIELAKRVLCHVTNTTSDALKMPKNMTIHSFNNMVNMANSIVQLPMYIDDTPLAFPLLKSKIRKMVQKHGVKLVIIDYLQLMPITGKFLNKNDAYGEMTKALKNEAKALGITIILLSQLSRDSEKNNRVPGPHDLRDSGAIESDADFIGILYRPKEDQLKEYPELKHGGVLMNVCKNRNGRTDSAVPFWEKFSTFSFYDTPLGAFEATASISDGVDADDVGNAAYRGMRPPTPMQINMAFDSDTPF